MKQIAPIFSLFLIIIASCNSDSKPRVWPESEQKGFRESCIANAKNGIGEDKAVAYCECMLKKIMKKYPNVNDAANIKLGETVEMGKECMPK